MQLVSAITSTCELQITPTTNASPWSANKSCTVRHANNTKRQQQNNENFPLFGFVRDPTWLSMICNCRQPVGVCKNPTQMLKYVAKTKLPDKNKNSCLSIDKIHLIYIYCAYKVYTAAYLWRWKSFQISNHPGQMLNFTQSNQLHKISYHSKILITRGTFANSIVKPIADFSLDFLLLPFKFE